MSNEKNSITTALEESFLSILRIVILIFLTISLVASIFLGFNAVSSFGAKPQKYELNKFNAAPLVDEIKRALDESKEASPQPTKKQNPKKSNDNKELEEEITKQGKALEKFLRRFGTDVSQNYLENTYRPAARKQANSYGPAFYGDGENGVNQYAKGNTEFFESIYTNSDILALLDKDVKKKVDLEDENQRLNVVLAVAERVTEFYPDFHNTELQKKAEFEKSSEEEVALKKAGAITEMSIAAGVFGAFLLIAFILVLVKIERNLRTAKISH